jgi:hypothetical protein
MVYTNVSLTISSFGDMSQSSISSNPINLNQKYGFSIHSLFTGSPVGTLKIQGSNDVGTDGIGSGVSNWSDIPGAIFSVTASGDAMFNLDATYYNWARLYYTSTSGTGTLTARLNSKGP